MRFVLLWIVSLVLPRILRAMDPALAAWIIDAATTRQDITEKSNGILAKYLPSYPCRELVVRPISLDFLTEKEPDFYRAYAIYVVNLEDDVQQFLSRREYLKATARLHVLNIFNKMAFGRFTARLKAGRSFSEDEACERIQCTFWLKSVNEELSMEPLENWARIMMELSARFKVNKLDRDEKLLLIPRIAHSLVEYMTISSLILNIRDPTPAVSILEKLRSLVDCPKESLEVLGSLIDDMHAKIESLREEAAVSVEKNTSHATKIHDISTSLDRVFGSVTPKSVVQVNRSKGKSGKIQRATQNFLRTVCGEFLRQRKDDDPMVEDFRESLEQFIAESEGKSVREMNRVIDRVLQDSRFVGIDDVLLIYSKGELRSDIVREVLELAKMLGSTPIEARRIHARLKGVRDSEKKSEIIENEQFLMSSFSEWDPLSCEADDCRASLYFKYDISAALQVNYGLCDLFKKHGLIEECECAFEDDDFQLTGDLARKNDAIAKQLHEGLQLLANLGEEEIESSLVAKGCYFSTYFQDSRSVGQFVLGALGYALPQPFTGYFNFDDYPSATISFDSFTVIRKALELQVFYRDLFEGLETEFSELEIACKSITGSDMNSFTRSLADQLAPTVARLELALDAKLREEIPNVIERLKSIFETKRLNKKPHKGERNLLRKIASVKAKAGLLVVTSLHRLTLKFMWKHNRMVSGQEDVVFQAIILSLVDFLKEKSPAESLIPLVDYLQELDDRLTDFWNEDFLDSRQVMKYAFEILNIFGICMLKKYPQVLPDWSVKKIYLARKIMNLFTFFDGPRDWEEFGIASLIVEADEERLAQTLPVLTALFDLRLESIESTPLVTSAQWLKEFLSNQERGSFIEWVRKLEFPEKFILLRDRIDTILKRIAYRHSPLFLAFRDLPGQVLRWEVEEGYLNSDNPVVIEVEKATSGLVDILESAVENGVESLLASQGKNMLVSIRDLLGVSTKREIDKISILAARLKHLHADIRNEPMDGTEGLNRFNQMRDQIRSFPGVSQLVRDLPERLSRLVAESGASNASPCTEAVAKIQDAAFVLFEKIENFTSRGIDPPSCLQAHAADILALADRISSVAKKKVSEESAVELETVLQDAKALLSAIKWVGNLL